MVSRFPQKELLVWYRRHLRRLPWRETKDPYRIWVSEMMLQQTQVATVIPYYGKFLRQFPDVGALAAAPVTQVLDTWSGLGYYSRAKNLHRAAQEVVRSHGGQFPSDPETLQTLPGIGRYTAGAIASIAFDRPAPILDGNVIRVLMRYFGIRLNPAHTATLKRLWKISEAVLDRQSPGDFNQAMMELGATICLPAAPDCGRCPLRPTCVAHRRGLQQKIPPASAAVKRKTIRYLCAIIEEDRSCWVARRPVAGLLGGLWEFPGGEHESSGGTYEQETLSRWVLRRLGWKIQVGRPVAKIRQLLTHRELRIAAFSCKRVGGRLRLKDYTELQAAPVSELLDVPLTAGMKQIARGIYR